MVSHLQSQCNRYRRRRSIEERFNHLLRSHVRKLSKFDSREEPKIDLTIRFGK
jgi:hypothetical protein